MDNQEPVYANVVKKQQKQKTVFENFPWKLKFHSRMKGDKVFARSHSASDVERARYNDVSDVSYDSQSSEPVHTPMNHFSMDDSCTVGYCLKRFSPTCSGEGDAPLEGECSNEMDSCQDLPENDAERRSRMFGTPIPLDILTGMRNGKVISGTSLPGEMVSKVQNEHEIPDDSVSVYANLPVDNCNYLETRDTSTTNCERANINDISDKNKRGSVVVCEVKPTVREEGAGDFKRERNKAIRRASSVTKKTVTFNLDKPDTFVDPPSPHPFRKIENIVIHPKPENGIIKNVNYTNAKDTFLYDDEPVPRSSQLSPNGTSSDSGRDSFLSCCSECNCSGPNHNECERPECQVFSINDDPLKLTMDRVPNITISEAESLKEAYDRALKTEEDPLKFTYERVSYDPAFITSKLEDSIYIARKNRKSNPTPRRLEPGVTERSAEYLNIDVAQAILSESRQNQFATYKSSEHIYASIKSVNEVSQKKEPPAIPPRESTQTNDVTRSKGMDHITKQTQVRGRHHKRPSKNDLLLLNKFHSYTLGDVMENYSSIVEDIPQENSLLRRSETFNDKSSSGSKAQRLSELTSNPINSHCVQEHKTAVKSSNTCLKTNEPQTALSRNPQEDQAKGDKVFNMRTDFGAKQKPFLSVHKQRAHSESAILKRLSLSVYNPSDNQVFGQRKSMNANQPVRNDPAKYNQPSSSGVAPSYPITNDSAPPRVNAPEAIQRARALNARFMDERRQEYASRSKSWSCWPDSFREISPIQCLPEHQKTSNPEINRLTGAKSNYSSSRTRLSSSQNRPSQSRTLSRTPSPNCQKPFPDVRWIVNPGDPRKYALSNAALSSSVAMSAPLIQWTKSEMAEIFC